jgi:hypothetical protein
VLNELTERGLTWLTLRKRGQSILDSLAALPASAWTTHRIVTVDLNLRTYHPALIDAGFADLDLPIPWWNDRHLRFRFPPR